MVKNDVAVFGRADGGKVDIFAWGRKSCLALLFYRHGERHTLFALVCRCLPCAHERTIMVRLISIVYEIVVSVVNRIAA